MQLVHAIPGNWKKKKFLNVQILYSQNLIVLDYHMVKSDS